MTAIRNSSGSFMWSYQGYTEKLWSWGTSMVRYLTFQNQTLPKLRHLLSILTFPSTSLVAPNTVTLLAQWYHMTWHLFQQFPPSIQSQFSGNCQRVPVWFIAFIFPHFFFFFLLFFLPFILLFLIASLAISFPNWGNNEEVWRRRRKRRVYIMWVCSLRQRGVEI